MIRRLASLIGIVVTLWAAGNATAGTISGTLRDLDGNPIADQANRTLTIDLRLANGVTVRVQQLGGPGTTPTTTNPLITLQRFAINPADVDDPTWRVTLNNAVFNNVTAANGEPSVAVAVRVSLAGRTDPGEAPNLIGTSNRVQLHQALPELPECPEAPWMNCCPIPEYRHLKLWHRRR